MKKSGSKDRLKSAGKKVSGPGQAVPSSSIYAAAAAAADDTILLSDVSVSFPEWSEAEVTAEKWNTKHIFDDPDGFPILPRSLRRYVESWKRPSDFIPEGQTPTIVGAVANNSVIDDFFHANSIMKTCPLSSLSNTNSLSDSRSNYSDPYTNRKYGAPPVYRTTARIEALGLATRDLFEQIDEESSIERIRPSKSNRSLTSGVCGDSVDGLAEGANARPLSGSMNKPDFTWTVTGDRQQNMPTTQVNGTDSLDTVTGTSKFFQNKIAKASGMTSDEFAPWDAIYPKAKDGLPTYNVSGKYIVKLFWMGAWRKVTVDDRIPFEVTGKPLFLSSTTLADLWPLLLTKALMKVAQLSFKECNDLVEYGDFDFLATLRGWVPEHIPIRYGFSQKVRSILLTFNSANNGTRSGLGSGTITASPTYVNLGASSNGPIKGLNNGPSATPAPQNTKLSTVLPPPGSAINPLQSRPPSSVVTQSTLFAVRQQNEANEIDSRFVSYPYRIMDVKEGFTPDGDDDQDPLDNFQIRVRLYSSCGYRKFPSIVSLREKSQEESVEFNDFWIKASEFSAYFNYLILYHPQGAFKVMKSVTHVAEQSKTDILKIPHVLSLPDDAASTSVVVLLSASGRVHRKATSSVPSVTVEEYSWDSPEQKEYQLRLHSNGTKASVFRAAVGHGYRFTVDCSSSFCLSVMSKEDFSFEEEGKFFSEKNGLKIKEFEDTCPAQSGSAWVVLFKHCLNVTEPTMIGAACYVPDSLQASASVRAINNDTGIEIPTPLYQTTPILFHPNKTGYTLLADCKVPGARPAFKWKARLFGRSLGVSISEKEISSTKLNVQDFDELYVPNKHHLLFRYVIKVKETPMNNISVQTTFSVPGTWLKIQLFDNDIEIATARGKNCATLYSAIIYQVEEAKSTDKDKKTKDATATSGGPKHKYILQALIEPSESVKLNLASMYADGNRPISRGKAQSGSAKKKKATSAGATGGSTNATGTSPGTTAAGESSDPLWHLRIVSMDSTSLIVTKDTEKEDRYRVIKETWETNNPGRNARAKDTRESYLKMIEGGVIRPVSITLSEVGSNCKPWTILKTQSPLVKVFGERLDRQQRGLSAQPGGPITHQQPSQSLATQNQQASQQALKETTPQSEPSPNASTPSPPDQPTDVAAPTPVLSFKTTVTEDSSHIQPQVIHPPEREKIEETRKGTLVQFEEAVETLKKSRLENKELRNLYKRLYLQVSEHKQNDLESWHRVDGVRRESYRVRLVKEQEEYQAKVRAAQEAFMKAVESVAQEQAPVDEAVDKRKKPGKK